MRRRSPILRSGRGSRDQLLRENASLRSALARLRAELDLPAATPHRDGSLRGWRAARRRIEDALRQNQAVLLYAAQLAHLGAWSLEMDDPGSPNAGRLRWTDEVYRIFGYEPNSVMVTNELFFAHVPPEEKQEIERKVAQAIAEGVPYEFEHHVVRPDGEMRAVHERAEVEHDALGRAVRIRGVVQDITERKRAEEALQRARDALMENEARLRATFDNAALGIVEGDAGGRLLRANRRFAEILGYPSPQALIGRSIDELTAPEDRALTESVIARLHRGEVDLFDFEKRYLRADGSPVWVHVSVSGIREHGGVLSRFIGTVEDITERKRAEVARLHSEQELRQAVEERTAQLQATIRELESFSYAVSHDLRAPIRAVNAYASIVLTDNESTLDEESKRHLEKIIQSGALMGQLVDELLSLSRLSRMEVSRKPVDMRELVLGVAEDLRAMEPPARKIRFLVRSLPTVEGSELLLKEAVSNLIGNALKYTRPKPAARIEVACRRQDGEYLFTVRDNGVGFENRYADKLFGVFQRLHTTDEFEGTGIGLALVKRIIERHGGRVSAEGTPGEGAVFTFTLPARQ